MGHPLSKLALSLIGLAGAVLAQGRSWDELILDGSHAVADHRYPEAENAFLAAFHTLEAVPEADDRVPASLHQLGTVYLLEGRYSEAKPLCLRAVTLRQKNLGNALPTAHSEVVLGTLYFSEGRYQEAEFWTRRALSILESQPGLAHGEMGAPCHGLANILTAQGKYREAEKAALRALEDWGPADSENQVNRANVMITLAQISESRRQYGWSVEYHAQALAILEKVLGPSHPNLVPALTSFALLSTATRNYPEAERLGRRALAIAVATLGSQHLDSATAALAVGMALSGQSRVVEAEPFYRSAMVVFEGSLVRQAAPYGVALRAYAQFLRRTKRLAEAKVLEARAQSNEAAPRQTVDVSEFRSHR